MGLGYFLDKNGDKSSGRLVKILAFIFSTVVAVIGLTIAAIALFTPRQPDMVMAMDGTTFVSLILGLVGLFLSVVLGSEITQKATNL